MESEVDNYTWMVAQLVRGMLTPYNKPVRSYKPISTLHLMPVRFQMHTTFAERQLRALKTIDAHLSTRTFLVGERITLADITVATGFQCACRITIDTPLRAQLPNLIRHLETVVNQPQFKDIYPPIEYIEKALQYVPPPKEKKEPKPAPPKAEKKAEKKQVKPADDDEEDEPAAPPPAKNPLDELPKSTFNLEDWKRAWSNMDTRGPGGSLEWFYQRYVENMMYDADLELIAISLAASIKRDSPSGVWTSSTTTS